MGNLEIWNKLSKTDPSHTKKFKRAGGFEGTAIKPMFSYQRMTEEFGPCGIGWGINRPEFTTVNAGDDVLVYCTVSIWYDGNPDMSVFGVGGDKVAGKNRNGVFTDDEAFKKAYTDAVTNALKLIGVGADVHMGMFDDNKYINAVTAHFAEEKQNKVESSKQAGFTQASRSLQAKLLTRVAQAKDKHDMQAVMDEIKGELDSLPDEMQDLINQEIENRLNGFENGISFPPAKHKFVGVEDALAWVTKVKPVINGFKSTKTLLEWQTNNQPYIDGLDIPKADKYTIGGKSFKERFTDALKAKYDELNNIEITQRPLAAE